MRLVVKGTDREINVGDEVVSFRGERTTVKGVEKPQYPHQEGRITTGLGYHYVGTYNLEWIGRGEVLYRVVATQETGEEQLVKERIRSRREAEQVAAEAYDSHPEWRGCWVETMR